MTILQQLTDRYTAHTDEVFRIAIAAVHQVVDTSPIVPFDVGDLERGITERDRRVAAPIYTVTVESTTVSGQGADYPRILEELPRIMPRRAKYLHWVDKRTGEHRYSKGFDNRHYQWWTRLWGDGRLWHDAVARGVNEAGYR